MVTYFSDRERGLEEPTLVDITPAAWRGIAAAIRTRISDGSFGASYPDMCRDGFVPCGTDEKSFWDAMAGEVLDLSEGENILFQPEPPSLLAVMDMIEFCWRCVGKPEKQDYHSHLKHHHLTFDEESGKGEYCDTINRIFQRNRLAYALTEDGNIERLLKAEVSEIVHARYQTNDLQLNEMLETSRRKFLSPDDREHRESLKSLWDAWERLKTIDGRDKKSGVSNLLDDVAGSTESGFRSMLESEARELTNIGNTFQIRHSETNQERLSLSDHIDYLWYRMFALIYLILHQQGAVEKSRTAKPIDDGSDDAAPF